MKTKYGEIKSIRDFFEDTKDKKYIMNPDAQKELQVMIEKVKCKLCGEIFEIHSSEGAMMGDGGRNQLGEHIELHKTVNFLK